MERETRARCLPRGSHFCLKNEAIAYYITKLNNIGKPGIKYVRIEIDTKAVQYVLMTNIEVFDMDGELIWKVPYSEMKWIPIEGYDVWVSVESINKLLKMSFAELLKYAEGKRNPYNVLPDYLNNRIVDEDTMQQAINKIAQNTEKTLRSYKNSGERNYQRYDDLFVAWTDHFNRKEKEAKYHVNPDISKAQSWIESTLGYSSSTSPNANAQNDIMQCLDPRNGNIYSYAPIAHNLGNNVWGIGVDRKRDPKDYVTMNSLNAPIRLPGNLSGSAVDGKYEQDFKVASNLFKPREGMKGHYDYQYHNSTPILSVAISVYTMQRLLKANNGNMTLALQMYNTNTEVYENSNGKQHKVNYAEGAIRISEGRLDPNDFEDFCKQSW